MAQTRPSPRFSATPGTSISQRFITSDGWLRSTTILVFLWNPSSAKEGARGTAQCSWSRQPVCTAVRWLGLGRNHFLRLANAVTTPRIIKAAATIYGHALNGAPTSCHFLEETPMSMASEQQRPCERWHRMNGLANLRE